MTNDDASVTGIRARKNLDAYYYSFQPTGDTDIDRILGAVASAGKEYHHTESWADDDIISPSPQDNIQNAANLAAKNRLSAIAPGGAASVEVREAYARIIDPMSFEMIDGSHTNWMMKNAALAKADQILALAASSSVDAEKVRVGDEVIVWPGAGKGLDYRARVEWIDGDRASVRPLDVALSSPAWVGSKRARTVKLTSLSRAAPSHIGNGGEGASRKDNPNG